MSTATAQTAAQGPLLTRQGLADYLGVGFSTVKSMLANGDAPPSVYIGRRRMFRVAAVDQWLEEKEVRTRRRERRALA